MHTRNVLLFATALLMVSGCTTLRRLDAGSTEQLIAQDRRWAEDNAMRWGWRGPWYAR